LWFGSYGLKTTNYIIISLFIYYIFVCLSCGFQVITSQSQTLEGQSRALKTWILTFKKNEKKLPLGVGVAGLDDVSQKRLNQALI